MQTSTRICYFKCFDLKILRRLRRAQGNKNFRPCKIFSPAAGWTTNQPDMGEPLRKEADPLAQLSETQQLILILSSAKYEPLWP